MTQSKRVAACMRLSPLFLAGLLIIASFFSGCAESQRPGDAQNPVANFQHEMLLAIDKEKRCPYGPYDVRRKDNVTIDFDYIDGGKADNFEIVKSSGDAGIDHAALMAVYFAKLPPKPSELNGVDHFEVQFNFAFRP